MVRDALTQAVARLGSQTPAPPNLQPNRELVAVLKAAERLRAGGGDDFVSVDHLILALVGDKKVAAIVKGAGCGVQELQRAVAEIKGGKKTTSKSAEDSFEVCAARAALWFPCR